MSEVKSYDSLIDEVDSMKRCIEKLKNRKKIFKMSKGLTEEEREINQESVKILNNEIRRLAKNIYDINIKLNYRKGMRRK